MRPVADRLWHERPFDAGREARAAAAAQARGLDLGDDRVAALVQDGLGAIPRAALARAVEAEVAFAVEVLEDAVLVVEHLGLHRFQRGRPTDRRRHLAVDLRSG